MARVATGAAGAAKVAVGAPVAEAASEASVTVGGKEGGWALREAAVAWA